MSTFQILENHFFFFLGNPLTLLVMRPFVSITKVLVKIDKMDTSTILMKEEKETRILFVRIVPQTLFQIHVY